MNLNLAHFTGYVEDVVSQYSLDDFRYHYRLTRDAFETLEQHILPYLVTHHRGSEEKVDPRKQLLVFCWYMSNQESMREIAQTFGIAKSTVHSIIRSVADIFCEHMSHVIIKRILSQNIITQ